MWMRNKRLEPVIFICLCLVGLIFYTKINVRTDHVPKSAIVSLVKPQDLYKVLETVRNVEDRWNHNFHHDWVFLSEQEFNNDFKSTISAFVSGTVHFRTINRKAHWKVPSNIDRNKVMNEMRELEADGIPYAGSMTYRSMCRFQSGLFMEYLPEYRYFARIDPDVKLYCDIEDDLFSQMHHGNYKLGYTIALRETPHAMHNSSRETNQFMKTHPEIINKNQWLDSFVQPWDAGCHFWSNLMIGDLEFFRSNQYHEWSRYLDDIGGIFYKRWGDAPIISIAASLFLNIQEVHWFSDVGSYHNPNVNCPTDHQERLRLRCSCPHDISLSPSISNKIFTYKEQSCVPQFSHSQKKPFQNNWRDFADNNVVIAYSED